MSTLSIVSLLINSGNGHKKSACSAHPHCIDLSLLGDKEKSLISGVWKPAFTAGLLEMKPDKVNKKKKTLTQS